MSVLIEYAYVHSSHTFLVFMLELLDKVVKSDSSKIEDEDVTFIDSLLVETIHDGSGSRLIDD